MKSNVVRNIFSGKNLRIYPKGESLGTSYDRIRELLKKDKILNIYGAKTFNGYGVCNNCGGEATIIGISPYLTHHYHEANNEKQLWCWNCYDIELNIV